MKEIILKERIIETFSLKENEEIHYENEIAKIQTILSRLKKKINCKIKTKNFISEEEYKKEILTLDKLLIVIKLMKEYEFDFKTSIKDEKFKNFLKKIFEVHILDYEMNYEKILIEEVRRTTKPRDCDSEINYRKRDFLALNGEIKEFEQSLTAIENFSKLFTVIFKELLNNFDNDSYKKLRETITPKFSYRGHEIKGLFDISEIFIYSDEKQKEKNKELVFKNLFDTIAREYLLASIDNTFPVKHYFMNRPSLSKKYNIVKDSYNLSEINSIFFNRDKKGYKSLVKIVNSEQNKSKYHKYKKGDSYTFPKKDLLKILIPLEIALELKNSNIIKSSSTYEIEYLLRYNRELGKGELISFILDGYYEIYDFLETEKDYSEIERLRGIRNRIIDNLEKYLLTSFKCNLKNIESITKIIGIFRINEELQ